MWSTWSWSVRSWSELLGGAARDVVGGVVVGEVMVGEVMVGEGENPLLLPRRAPTGGELPGKPLGWYWCTIKVGKSVAKPRRVQWWGQGGGWGFLGFQPR